MNMQIPGKSVPHSAEALWSWHGGSGALIWQLMFSTNDMVMGIKRLPRQRAATLFCLESSTGCVLCDNFVLTGGADADAPVGEGWMTGLETTLGELLFCHTYQPGSPEHQGIWAVDLKGNGIVWSRPDLVYAANLGDSLLAYRSRVFAGFPERDYWLIDPLSGRELDHPGMDHELSNRLRLMAESEQERQNIILPDPGFDESGQVEHIDCGTWRASAFHRMRTGKDGAVSWESFLTVTAGDHTLYEDMMATSETIPVFNNFLIRKGRLYYIKEKESLISVTVS
jgi:hypothetical protein